MPITNFIPAVWSKKILTDLLPKLVALNLTNRDYQGEISNQGDTVNIISPADISISDYSGADITWADVSDSVKQLLIDTAKSFSFQVKDTDKKQSIADILAIFSRNAGERLAESLDKDLFEVMGLNAHADNTIGSPGSPVVISKTNIYENIVNASALLSKMNVPRSGRFLVLSPDEIVSLVQSDVVLRSTSQGDNVVRTGYMGSIAGFDIYESNNLYSPDPATITSGNPVPRYLIFGHKVATTFAQQISSVERVRIQDNFADGVKGLLVYGKKVVYPKALGAIIVDSNIDGTM
jgi:hypothetical protein